MIGASAATAGKGREALDAIGDATESRHTAASEPSRWRIRSPGIQYGRNSGRRNPPASPTLRPREALAREGAEALAHEGAEALAREGGRGSRRRGLPEEGSAFPPGAAPGLPRAAGEAAPSVGRVALRLISGAQDEPGVGVGRVDRHGLFARLDGRGHVSAIERSLGILPGFSRFGGRLCIRRSVRDWRRGGGFDGDRCVGGGWIAAGCRRLRRLRGVRSDARRGRGVCRSGGRRRRVGRGGRQGRVGRGGQSDRNRIESGAG